MVNDQENANVSEAQRTICAAHFPRKSYVPSSIQGHQKQALACRAQVNVEPRITFTREFLLHVYRGALPCVLLALSFFCCDQLPSLYASLSSHCSRQHFHFLHIWGAASHLQLAATPVSSDILRYASVGKPALKCLYQPWATAQSALQDS